MTEAEVRKLVQLWIGVDGGYLGDFGYSSHDLFWLQTCDKAVDTHAFDGTTRECFIATLLDASPRDQALALDAVVERFPIGATNAPAGRTPVLLETIGHWKRRLLDIDAHVPIGTIDAGEVVRRALSDADVLLASANGAVSAVDRVHTALHGYLKELCRQAGIDYPEDPTLTKLFRLLREGHPAFEATGPRHDDIERVFHAHATVLDALNPLRNRASVAHANELLLDEPEARLVVNTVRTVFGYLTARLLRSADAAR